MALYQVEGLEISHIFSFYKHQLTVLFSTQCFQNMCQAHRYISEIPEPTLSLSRHWALIRVFGFSFNQNNGDLSGLYVLQSEREDKHA